MVKIFFFLQYVYNEVVGFCYGYFLVWYDVESEVNKGGYEVRQDWIKYIGCGFVGEYGGCNFVDGYFCVLVLLMCKLEWLRLVFYFFECMFLLLFIFVD